MRIIVVNDGSTDGTAWIIDSFQHSDPRILSIHFPQNRGVSAARNAGIAASSAPFVAFLDGDDIWLPEKLDAQVEVFKQSGPETGFVHSSCFIIKSETRKGLPGVIVEPPTRRGDIFMPLLLNQYHLTGSASSVLVRRDVLGQAGYFDEQIFYGEDADFWIRLAHISHVDFTPKAVVGIRAHDQSTSRRNRKERLIEFFQQRLLIYSKWEKELAPVKRSLRHQFAFLAFGVVLYRRSLADGLVCYQILATHECPLLRHLFHNTAHFWLVIFLRTPAILWREIKRVTLHYKVSIEK